MDTDKVVREQLLSLLKGGNAHLGFDQVVDKFPMAHANSRVPNVPYSPWHLLEHLRIAQWDILEFIRNPDHVSPDWPKGYWPAPGANADANQWRKTLRQFRADLKALQDLVADPKTNLYAPLSHAKNYTILRELLLVADHNAYHLGQLVLLRKTLDI